MLLRPVVNTTCALLVAGAAAVADADHRFPNFTISGFGTLGVVHSNEDDADFVNNIFQESGAGYTDEWAAGVDSKLGIQLDTDFSDRLAGVLQVVAQQNGSDGAYTPIVEWANLKYAINPDLSIRAGRSVFPEFMVSDYRLVGYANPWVRPPVEVYSTVPVTNNDGIEVIYRYHSGRLTYRLQALYGTVPTREQGNGSESTGRDNWGIANTFEYGPFTVHLGYTTVKRLEIAGGPLNGLVDSIADLGNTLSTTPGAESAGAAAISLANRYRPDSLEFADFTVGFSYDPGDWLLITEWASGRREGLFTDSISAYITGGYRFGDITPYVTLARLDHDNPEETGIPTAGLPAPLDQQAAGLNAGLNAVLNGIASNQETISIGIRWDLMSDAALKVQYDRIDLGAGSSGTLTNVQPDFEPGGELDVFSVAMDFLF